MAVSVAVVERSSTPPTRTRTKIVVRWDASYLIASIVVVVSVAVVEMVGVSGFGGRYGSGDGAMAVVVDVEIAVVQLRCCAHNFCED